MISRYALYKTAELSNRFQVASGLPKGVKPHYNISPTTSSPVIINHNGERIVKLMKWGLVAQGAKDTNSVFRYKTYNIPSEKILSKHSWERAVRENRCLVPADGFYDLSTQGEKRAFYMHPKTNETVSFAGIHSSWQDPDGITHDTFSIITIGTNDDMPKLSGRMPVIISKEDESRWLDNSINDGTSIYDMLRTPSNGTLTAYEVSAAVHSPKVNQANLIERI